MKFAAVIVFALALLGTFGNAYQSPSATASTPDLQLRITGLECTLDTTYSQQVPNVTLQPEDCSREPVVESLGPLETTPLALPQEATRSNDPTPGDQAAFENTPLESIAGWMGIGNSSVKPARPLIATGIIFAIAFGAFDAVVLESRTTRSVSGAVRRRASSVGRVVTRGS